jgi:hypothetical protein
MATIAPQGENVIRAHLEHLLAHGEEGLHAQAVAFLREHGLPVPGHGGGAEAFASCPGAAAREIPRAPVSPDAAGGPVQSELRQWPIQLRLVNPAASWFDNADLLVAADCTPFAYGDFHREFLAGKVAIVFCPKLDRDLEEYTSKLAEIFRRHQVRSVTILRMEVPCCGGVRYVVDGAIREAGVGVPVTERVIAISGELRPPAG